MATIHISFRLLQDDKPHVIHPVRTYPPLFSTEIDEHQYTLSNEIWGMIATELKSERLSNRRVDKNSITVVIDTDDNQTINVPREVILCCFNS